MAWYIAAEGQMADMYNVTHVQSLRAFRRAALIGVWSVVFWSWGVLGRSGGVIGPLS